jgi:hypothetical protein
MRVLVFSRPFGARCPSDSMLSTVGFGVRAGKWWAAYQARIKLPRLQRFQRNGRYEESITYVFSINGEGSNPTLSAISLMAASQVSE